jgi:hypothetical protein
VVRKSKSKGRSKSRSRFSSRMTEREAKAKAGRRDLAVLLAHPSRQVLRDEWGTQIVGGIWVVVWWRGGWLADDTIEG